MEFLLVAEQQVLGMEIIEQEREHADRRTRLRQLRDASNPFEESEFAFKGLYRLSRDLARRLIAEIRPFLHEGVRPTSVPLEITVLCALHFYGSGSYQKSVGSNHHLGLSQPSVSTAIAAVTEALQAREIISSHIKYPKTAAQREALMDRNFIKCRIPGVLGFVDGTFIAIKQPLVHEELFVCRKGFHALNAQIVCDSDNHILNVVSRFNGSANDSFVWSNSSIRTELETTWTNGQRCWLLGDSGYPLEPWLHVPYTQTVPGSHEELYNVLHRTARSVVERTIGLLKGRFRCLMRHRALHYEPLKASRIINACCVLHNMCIRANLELDEEEHQREEEEGRQEGGVPGLQEVVCGRRNHIREEGERVRAGVALRLRH